MKTNMPTARQKSGKEWENETWAILKEVFPNDIILYQVTTSIIPRKRPDFAVIYAGLVIECKACGLAPVQEEVLVEHERRQDLFEASGITYVWWVDRERNNLVDKDRSYLKHIFYNNRGEKANFTEFLQSFAPRTMH